MAVLLLIDPNPKLGTATTKMLTRSGHDVMRVNSILAAVRLLKKTRDVDAVVFRDEFDTTDGFSLPELMALFNLPSIALTDDLEGTGADILEALGKLKIPTNA